MYLGRGNNNFYTLYDQISGTWSPPQSKKIWEYMDMSSSLHCHKIASSANQVLGRLKHSFKYRSAPSFTMLNKNIDLISLFPYLESSFCQGY